MADEESGEKQHEASDKKLLDARKKGEFAKSIDLTTASVYGGFIVAFYVFGDDLVARFLTPQMRLFSDPHVIIKNVFDEQGTAVLGTIAQDLLGSAGIWFAILAIFALLSILAQRGFVIVPSNLAPKASRISPISNLKNKLGRKGLFEFSKSFLKLVVSGSLAFWFLADHLGEIVLTMQQGALQVSNHMVQLLAQFLLLMFLFTLMIGLLDFFWQRKEHLRKNMMTHQEVKDEAKSAEGDPHAKQQRRQRGFEIASKQMISDVKDADVVVVNPTHYAVALKWDRWQHGAPVCVAKGVDEIAARIREAAQTHAVPIHSDPPTARALHGVLEIGDEVPEDQYEVVAAAIRFAEAMRRKAKRSV